MSEDVNKLNVFHIVIQNVLNITIRKSERVHTQPNCTDQPKLYVGHLYGRITGITNTENKYLNVEDLDDLVRSIVYVCILHNKNVLMNLNESYNRVANFLIKINKGEGFNQLFLGINLDVNFLNSLKDDVILLLESVQSFLISNSSLLMIFPVYFNLTDLLNENEIKRAYLNVVDDKVLSEMFLDFATSNHNYTFLQNIVKNMWESDSNIAQINFTNILNFLRFRLSMKPLKSNNSNEVKFLSEVLVLKPVVELFLDNIILVELDSPMLKTCGVKRELLSIIGRLLNTTTLDEECYEVSKILGLKTVFQESKLDRTTDFYGKKDLNHIKSMFTSKRFESEHSINNTLQMVKIILKSDISIRNKFLSILGRFISFNTNRKKVYGLTHIDTPPVSIDPMYFHRLIMIPDNSFGFCLNFTWLLLLLSQGITLAKSDEIDPCYCQISSLANQELKLLESRNNESTSENTNDNNDNGNNSNNNNNLDNNTNNNNHSNMNKNENNNKSNNNLDNNSKDIETQKKYLMDIEIEMNNMLGFLSSSSCMGDENQVKKSLNLLNITVKNLYNSKFITQIFWLTLKSINMLFLPCLQENLKILSQTLNYANNTPNPGATDNKLANYISYIYVWRTTLQHPLLLKSLWHFINLSLRLFLRCFLLYDNNGKLKLDYKQLYDNSKGKFNILIEKYCENVIDTDKLIPSPQFIILPVDLIETILDLIKNLTILRQYDYYIKPIDNELLNGMDLELIISTCIFIMKCPNNIIKNISIKCDMACSTILYLCKFSGESINKFETINTCKLYLMDALVRTFISSQKSNYNTRISSRLNIIQSFTQFFVLESYKKNFVSCIISKRDLFIQFMHLLLNDTNFLIEEVVSYLTEIRRREIAGISLDDPQEEEQQQQSSSITSRRQINRNNNSVRSDNNINNMDNENEDDDDEEDSTRYVQEGSIDSNQLKSMSGTELKGRTRSFVEYGFEICSLLNILCNEFPNDIISSSVLLPQVATCLGCCLESLAGPKCLQLKVKNMDEYGFKPREWLSKIMQCYISLYENKSQHNIQINTQKNTFNNNYNKLVNNSENNMDLDNNNDNTNNNNSENSNNNNNTNNMDNNNNEVNKITNELNKHNKENYNIEQEDDDNDENENPFVKAVVGDERYYKPEIFNRCIRFATREMFLTYRSIKSFKNLSDKLLEQAQKTSLLYDNTINDEIPENYLDPIMMDIMEDPVLLPTSGKIMDRKNIERHLMSESTDPFTRAFLEREQLIEQPELKKQIQLFLKSLSKSTSNL